MVLGLLSFYALFWFDPRAQIGIKLVLRIIILDRIRLDKSKLILLIDQALQHTYIENKQKFQL